MDRALDGCYDDYRSEFANPITALIQDSRRFGLADIAERAKKGDFDGTATDSLAWEHRIQTEDPETAQVLNMLKQK